MACAIAKRINGKLQVPFDARQLRFDDAIQVNLWRDFNDARPWIGFVSDLGWHGISVGQRR